MATVQPTVSEAVKQVLSKRGTRLQKCAAIVPLLEGQSIDQQAAIFKYMYMREQAAEVATSDECLPVLNLATLLHDINQSHVEELVDRTCNAPYHSDVYSEKALARELRGASHALRVVALDNWLGVPRWQHA